MEMKLDFGLQLQQEQKLIMTQELQLAVKILQLTSYELNEYIEEQLIENPLLEAEEKAREEEHIRLQNLVSYGDDDKDYYRDDSEDEDVSPINFVSQTISLWEHLKEQLNLIPISQKYREVGEYIIDNIDENGYLTVDGDDITLKHNITAEEAEKVINLIQNLEPAGICARSINECLLLQIKARGLHDETYENIINHMLEDVARGKIAAISRENGISIEEAQEYIDVIKSLDPKPGIRFSNETTRYIIPDVIVEKIDNKYVVSINDEFIPSIKINNTYKRILNDKDSAGYNFVKERLNAAVWLIKSIEQRMITIKRVVDAIIRHQYDFFESDMDLRPLTLKQIAHETNLHESTISRAIKGKYVQTPKGLFEIKNFFIRGIQSQSGEEIGTNKIKQLIKQIIEKENKAKPLSDQQISDMVSKEGFSISRRTVTKYREEMDIQSSSKRKEIK
jgi:RNA polymerase sigma-54 factor